MREYEKQKPRYEVGDIIGTKRDRPHMILSVFQKESNSNPDKYYYILIDLLSGKKEEMFIGHIDGDTHPLDEIPERDPLAKSEYHLEDAGWHVKLNMQSNKTLPLSYIEVGGVVGLGGGAP